jgi:hypothetical protein
MAKTNFTVIVQRVSKEEYEMTLEATSAMQALDEARRMCVARNKRSTTGTFSVISVEEKNK